jgi:hypothetical protein
MLRLVLASAVVISAATARADGPSSAESRADFDRVGRRVRSFQPTAEERRFDEIGWARDIREARRLAREHGRPVFLFTHDGHMNVGRC